MTPATDSPAQEHSGQAAPVLRRAHPECGPKKASDIWGGPPPRLEVGYAESERGVVRQSARHILIPGGLMDTVFTVGQYTLVSMALNSLGVQLDPGLEGFSRWRG